MFSVRSLEKGLYLSKFTADKTMITKTMALKGATVLGDEKVMRPLLPERDCCYDDRWDLYTDDRLLDTVCLMMVIRALQVCRRKIAAIFGVAWQAKKKNTQIKGT